MCESKGRIFDIQHFSVSDGPGIRTTVFFKGCPLRCAWCHNPESYIAETQILVHLQKCTNCALCTAVCPHGCHSVGESRGFSAEACTVCGACVRRCPSGAISLVGRDVTAKEVLDAVLEDAVFYETSGGGITLSGGEPMAQPHFAIALAKAAKAAGLHVCMETSGYCKAEHLQAIAPYIDLFLFDYKCADSEKHIAYTGVDNREILANLRMLDAIGAKTVLRCPLIPAHNMEPWHIEGIIGTAQSLTHLAEIHLEPYHNLGISKREGLGKKADKIRIPERESILQISEQIAAATGLSVTVL